MGSTEEERHQPVHARDSALIGAEFGGYIIEGIIGRGGMGTVYRGRQQTLSRPVAIKVVRGDADEQDFGPRFAREARAAAAISHPNVVHVFDFGSFPGGWYLVTELVEGANLQDLLAEGGPLDPDISVLFVLQAVRGLTAIADAGLIHRDIKPGNLLISPGQRLKIADFGLARRESRGDLTMAGQILGTPAYMSPEQWRGDPLDHRTDQYSLGVTAYGMLTGQRAFAGEGVLQIMKAVSTATPAWPHTIRPQVPGPISRVVMRMMAREAGDRFPDHRACVTALEQAWQASDTPATGIMPTLRSQGFGTPPPTIPPGGSSDAAQPHGGTTSFRRRCVLPSDPAPPNQAVVRTPLPTAAPASPPAGQVDRPAPISTRRLRGRQAQIDRLIEAIAMGRQALQLQTLHEARQAVEQALSRLLVLAEQQPDPALAAEVAELQRRLRWRERRQVVWRALIILTIAAALAGVGLLMLAPQA